MEKILIRISQVAKEKSPFIRVSCHTGDFTGPHSGRTLPFLCEHQEMQCDLGTLSSGQLKFSSSSASKSQVLHFLQLLALLVFLEELLTGAVKLDQASLLGYYESGSGYVAPWPSKPGRKRLPNLIRKAAMGTARRLRGKTSTCVVSHNQLFETISTGMSHIFRNL